MLPDRLDYHAYTTLVLSALALVGWRLAALDCGMHAARFARGQCGSGKWKWQVEVHSATRLSQARLACLVGQDTKPRKYVWENWDTRSRHTG